MKTLVARRITSAKRRGSSRPIVVDTDAGVRIVKLRGAGQGTGALVAETIVGGLAEVAGLHVPPRVLIDLPTEIDTADWDDELADLLAASVGINLGFDYLDGAQEIDVAELDRIPIETRASILWLDRFVLNADRSTRNSNLLWWSDQLWLIDHGACLRFQYDWSAVTEDSPRLAALTPVAHLFERSVPNELLRATDARLAPLFTRAALERAVSEVPDAFLDGGARVRAAFVAYLWKRLKEPRPFLDERELPADRLAGRPQWLGG